MKRPQLNLMPVWRLTLFFRRRYIAPCPTTVGRPADCLAGGEHVTVEFDICNENINTFCTFLVLFILQGLK